MEQEKADKRRRAIADEIVTTEHTYVEALGIVLKRAIHPLRELANTPDAILSLAEVVNVFANFEVIYNCHANLLIALKVRLNNWEREPNMGDVFLEKGAFMKLYTHYINNFETSIATLKMYKTTKEKFKKFVEDFDRDNQNQEDSKLRLQLDSFLIMPVQRIPRYVLLLRDLSKNTADTHTDYKPINTALEVMEQLAKTINTSKSQKDNKEKLEQLQETVLNCPFNFLDEPDRVFLKEGSLINIKSGSRLGQDAPLVLTLFSDGVLISRELHNKLKYKAWIPLATAHAEILTLNGNIRNSSEDVSNNSMPHHPPPLIHQKSSPLLTYTPTSTTKSPRQSKKNPQPIANTSPNSPQLGVKKSFSQHSIDFESLTHQKILLIKSPKGSYQFYSKTTTDTEMWFTDITNAIENEMQGLVGQNLEKNSEANLKLLKNLLVVENIYKDKLQLLQREFMKPLEDSIKSKHPILNADLYNTIFGPFTGEVTMQHMHTIRLGDKIKSWSKLSKITDIYNMEWLSTYRIHVRSHRAQSEGLSLIQQDSNFKAFELLHTTNDGDLPAVNLGELLAHPLRNLSSCYVIFRQILLHTTDIDDTTALKELVAAIKLIYEEQQNFENVEAGATPEAKVKDYSKLRKSLKFWKTRRRSLPGEPPKNIDRSKSSVAITTR